MVYTAEELDAFLRSGALERIGMGSRRSCYLLPGNSGLCLKCYKSDAEIQEGKDPGKAESRPMAPAAVKEIRTCRFDQRRNTCCEEYRYWKNVIQNTPAEVKRIFPATMEMLKLPSRGWCLLEEFMLNDDGSAITKFLPAWQSAGEADRKRLVAALSELEESFLRHSIRFFDPQTIMVQRSGGEPRLRIPDFEPSSRTLIPIDILHPVFIRIKTQRRFARYRKTWDIR